MNCELARATIEPYFDGELDAGRAAEMGEHLAGCGRCMETYANLERLREDIRTRAPYYTPSSQLEGRVRAALREAARPERSSSSWQWMAVAAAVVLTISVGVVMRQRPSSNIDQTLVESHVRSLIGAHLLDVPSSDQHTVKPWFNGKLDFAPDVKDFAAEGFPLAGGRVDYAGGRAIAALIYHRRQHVINVFTWPEASPAGNSEKSENGYNVLHWSKAGMTYWAVSDLRGDELRELERLYLR